MISLLQIHWRLEVPVLCHKVKNKLTSYYQWTVIISNFISVRMYIYHNYIVALLAPYYNAELYFKDVHHLDN